MVDSTPGMRWKKDGLEDPFESRYDCERAKLPMGHLSDDELANELFLYDHRMGLKSMSYLTAGKERIRWLTRKLDALERLLAEQQRPSPTEDGSSLIIHTKPGFWKDLEDEQKTE